MKAEWKLLAIESSFALIFALSLSADQVPWPLEEGGNGHFYEAFFAPNGITREEAMAVAQRLGGHLATISSEQENAFLAQLISHESFWYKDLSGNGIGPWLGGLQTAGSSEPAGGWRWVNDEPWEYTKWAPGEPNNSGGNEQFLHFFGPGGNPNAFWNDLGGGVRPKGCVVEYTAAPGARMRLWPESQGGNGHWYQVVEAPGGITWTKADQQAREMGGHLASILSAEENDFVFSLASGLPVWYVDGSNNGIGPWLGGFQPEGSPEPGGGWRWVTEEPWGYTKWAPGEPNNLGNSESRLHLFGPGALSDSSWNDLGDSVQVLGYVVEYPEMVLRIQSISLITGDSIAISWNNLGLGYQYVLETSSIAYSTDWTPMEGGSWPSLSTTFFGPAPEGDAAFFRVQAYLIP